MVNGPWEDVSEITLNAQNDWSGKYDYDNIEADETAVYRVREKENAGDRRIIENYGEATMSFKENGETKTVPCVVRYTVNDNTDLVTIRNIRKVENNHTVKINWENGNNQITNQEPVEIVLQRSEVGGPWYDVETRTLSSNNNWQTQFALNKINNVQYRVREKESAGNQKLIEFDDGSATMNVTQNGEIKPLLYSVRYNEEDAGTTITNKIAGNETKHSVSIFWDDTPEEIIPESVKVVLQRNNGDGKWKTIQSMQIKKADHWVGVFQYERETENEEYRVRELNADEQVVLDSNNDNVQNDLVQMWYRTTDTNNNERRIYINSVTCTETVKDPNFAQYECITNIRNNTATEKYTIKIDWDEASKQAGLPEKIRIREQSKEAGANGWEDAALADLDRTLSEANFWSDTFQHDYLSTDYIPRKDNKTGEILEIPVSKRLQFRCRLVDSDGNTVNDNGILKLKGSELAWQVTYETNGYNTIVHMSLEGRSFSVKITWENENIPDYIPDSAVAILQGSKNENGNGEWEEIQGIQPLTLNRDNHWTGDFAMVPGNLGYKKFRVREKDSENKIILLNSDVGYQNPDDNKASFVIAGQNNNVIYQTVTYKEENGLTTITNKEPVGSVIYSAEINWGDYDNRFTPKEPITVVLQRKENNEWVEKETVELNENNYWRASFNAVPRSQGDQYRIREKENANGNNRIVEEGEYARFRMTREGENEPKNVNYLVNYGEENQRTSITNTFKGDNTNVKVSIIWKDELNDQKIRPESVTIKLIKNNEATNQTLVLNNDKKWEGKFENLPLLNDQQLTWKKPT